MKKFALALLFCLPLQAVIIETPHFRELPRHVTHDTLVVLDIDDTLLVPPQMLGCDEWFSMRWDAYKEQGYSYMDSLEKSLAEWKAVRHLTEMDLVETGTDGVVQKLQHKGFQIMGLTTQDFALASHTPLQLKEHGIDLEKTSPTAEECFMNINGRGVLFRHGTLFTSAAHKGVAFFAFCDKVGLTPKRIVFINDREKDLHQLEEVAEERGIEFVGLRYAYSDRRKEKFCKEIAHYQFHNSTLSRLISDEEARVELGNVKQLDIARR